jgi:adenylate cyclase
MDKYSRKSTVSNLALRRKVRRLQKWAAKYGVELSY